MIELRPLGVLCNIQCQYCYQNPQRDAGNLADRYDMDRMVAAIKAEGGPFAMFGGEPLLVDISDLERLWSWGLKEFGYNAIQTNGTLISDEHVRMFREYNVNVGISIDGPGELNDVRWHGTLEKTRAATRKTEHAIQKLCDENLPPSLIITLHQGNASAARLPSLLAWVQDLDAVGIRHVGLHLLESESAVVRARYSLTIEQNIAALLGFLELQKSVSGLHFDMFTDMKRMLRADDHGVSCVWSACDPYTTPAVRGVEGDGQRSNCGRTNKDGIDFGKSATEGYERYLALYQTPQSAGGCSGCRFFLMCKGQCPGTALDGDWRNRTEHCEVWKALYSRLEAELLQEGVKPLSLSPARQRIERRLLDSWVDGRSRLMAHVTAEMPSLPSHAGPLPLAWQSDFEYLAHVVEEAFVGVS